MVADERGHVYVNSIGFAFPGEEPAPGLVALVTPDGVARRVAGGLAFPDGMAITADGRTLLVAESYASRLTAYPDRRRRRCSANARVWAETPADHPDGICLDAGGLHWYADVGNRHCVRVCEGGEVLGTVTWTAAPSPARSAGVTTRTCSSSASTTAEPSLAQPQRAGRGVSGTRPGRRKALASIFVILG